MDYAFFAIYKIFLHALIAISSSSSRKNGAFHLRMLMWIRKMHIKRHINWTLNTTHSDQCIASREKKNKWLDIALMKMIASFKSDWSKKKENIVMYGNAISFNIFRYYFFKSNSMHHFWEYLLCRWGNAKKPLKILLLSVRIQTARALLMSFSHTHEKYVARKHGFPILFFKYIVHIRRRRAFKYILYQIFCHVVRVFTTAEMDGAIFYPDWHLPIHCNLSLI